MKRENTHILLKTLYGYIPSKVEYCMIVIFYLFGLPLRIVDKAVRWLIKDYASVLSAYCRYMGLKK